MRYRLLLCALFALPALAAPAEPPLQPYHYAESWETGGPAFELWAKNGESKVAFNGPSTEQAAAGQWSFKLDVQLLGGSYHYFGVPLHVPCHGKLTLTAKVLVAAGTTARVGFGTNMVYPPTHHSGCGATQTWERPTNGWQTVTIDLVDVGRDGAASVVARETGTAEGTDVGAVLDRWGLFIYGGAGQRAVVYVDDVRLDGEVPSEADYTRLCQERWQAAAARLKGRLDGYRARLTAAEAELAQVAGLPADLVARLAPLRARLAAARQAMDNTAKRGYGDSRQFQDLEATMAAARYGPANIRAIAAAQAANRPLVVYAPPAIRDEQPTAGQFPVPAPPADRLALSGCAGEYGALSLAVQALQPLHGLTLEVGDLAGPGAGIPAAAVDARVVKCWYQAGRGIADLRHKRLVAELLLKDDRLVKVDLVAQQNYLRHTAPDGTTSYRLCSGPTSENLAGVRPLDAATLQPVDLEAGDLKQFWLTIHLPATAAAGTYRGPVTLRWPGGSQVIELTVTVHPFALQPSKLIYSIYYRACLSPQNQPGIDSEVRSSEQYLAEMRDLLAHGVPYPTNYLGWNEAPLRRTFELRREAGLPGGPLFNLGLGTGNNADPARLKQLQADVRKWLALGREFGYDTLYCYGIDEASGDQLASQRAAWRAVQEAGGKTFVACYLKTFEAMGKLLDVAVLAGRPDPQEAAKYHSVGALAFCYANPQVGEEAPETYRRNYGLMLWQAGFDGAMDYAYQHGFHHVWNDFDDPTYRDHNFTYPTVNGIVPTVQWEGFREAVNDVRYLTTVSQAIANAPAARKAEADAAAAWLKGLDPLTTDLDAMRVAAVDWIGRLR